jgi:hypothetical protein
MNIGSHLFRIITFIYVLHNCHVYDNDASFKICEGHFKVVFGSCTKFTKFDDITNLPLHEFHFKSFKEVQKGKFKINILYGKFTDI